MSCGHFEWRAIITAGKGMRRELQQDIKIVFIANSLSQPRIQRRIIGFRKKGYAVKVYGFDRDQRRKDIDWYGAEVVSLGYHQSGGGYLKKFIDLVRLRRKVSREVLNGGHVLYIFGPMTMFAFLFGRAPYIYEISDLIYGNVSAALRSFLNVLTRMSVNRSLFTVVTSKGFTKYFFGVSDHNKIVYMPNKLSPELRRVQLEMPGGMPKGPGIKFGFVGSPRFEDTIFRFARNIGEKYPHHTFHFFGTSELESYGVEFADRYSNVFWHGKYFNPDDLPRIYSHIDVVVSCYYSKSLGSRIAEPNKLFESIFFSKPIVVSSGTHVADLVVNKLKSGFSIDAYSDESICAFVDGLTPERIQSVLNNISDMDKSEMIDDDGHLFERLDVVMNEPRDNG